MSSQLHSLVFNSPISCSSFLIQQIFQWLLTANSPVVFDWNQSFPLGNAALYFAISFSLLLSSSLSSFTIFTCAPGHLSRLPPWADLLLELLVWYECFAQCASAQFGPVLVCNMALCPLPFPQPSISQSIMGRGVSPSFSPVSGFFFFCPSLPSSCPSYFSTHFQFLSFDLAHSSH